MDLFGGASFIGQKLGTGNSFTTISLLNRNIQDFYGKQLRVHTLNWKIVSFLKMRQKA